MQKFFGLLMFVGVLALAACGGTGSGGDDGSGCGDGCSGGGEVADNTQMMIDNYVNGTVSAQYYVQLHEGAAAGQYWETSGEAYGTTTTQRWQVAKVDGDMAVVEWQMKSDSAYGKSDYVIAFQIDTTVAMGDVNVQKAWIGKPGDEGTEIKVMEKVEATCGATSDYETTTEEFADVELGGGKWSGTLTTIKGEGFEMQTWVANDGWFNGVIKSAMNGATSSELKAFGDDATPLLKW